MNVKVLLTVLVVGLLVVPLGWAEEVVDVPQSMIGVGGSFLAGTPAFDAFFQFPLGEVIDLRANLMMLFAGQGNYAFAVDGAAIVGFDLDAFTPYVGAGGGALVFIDQVGNVLGMLTVNALAGAMLELGDGFGVYGQTRFFGALQQGVFQGWLAPGLGLFIRF